jgi:hypothetical protein
MDRAILLAVSQVTVLLMQHGVEGTVECDGSEQIVVTSDDNGVTTLCSSIIEAASPYRVILG